MTKTASKTRIKRQLPRDRVRPSTKVDRFSWSQDTIDDEVEAFSAFVASAAAAQQVGQTTRRRLSRRWLQGSPRSPSVSSRTRPPKNAIRLSLR